MRKFHQNFHGTMENSENQNVRERLKSYIKFKNMSVRSFESSCGLSYGFVGNMRNSMQPDKITRISHCFPELNTGWLMTGEGEMLKESQNSEANNEPIIKKSRNGNPRMIPFYDAETTGGYEGRVSSSNEEVSLRGYINAGDWFDGRETAAIRHVGNSMVEYPDGCILAVREVRERRLLVPGRNYVIETDEYRVTKRVQKGTSQQSIALYSSNQEKYDDGRLIYEPFEVDLSDVRHIFSVLGYIVNQYGECKLITT